eukprot:COSAG06_NODE_6838_length_2751_cov_49.510181_2_plen_115_part_00
MDVYAFGVLVWELFAEQMPFDGYDIPTVKEKVLSGERPPAPLSCPRVVQRLYSDCWATNMGDRPKMADVVPRVETAMQSLRAAGYSSGSGSSLLGSTGSMDMGGFGDALDSLMK